MITQACVFHIQAAGHADKPAVPPRHFSLSRRASKSDVSPAQVHKKSPLTRVNTTKVLKDVIADVTEADIHTRLFIILFPPVLSLLLVLERVISQFIITGSWIQHHHHKCTLIPPPSIAPSEAIDNQQKHVIFITELLCNYLNVTFPICTNHIFWKKKTKEKML